MGRSLLLTTVLKTLLRLVNSWAVPRIGALISWFLGTGDKILTYILSLSSMFSSGQLLLREAPWLFLWHPPKYLWDCWRIPECHLQARRLCRQLWPQPVLRSPMHPPVLVAVPWSSCQLSVSLGHRPLAAQVPWSSLLGVVWRKMGLLLGLCAASVFPEEYPIQLCRRQLWHTWGHWGLLAL